MSGNNIDPPGSLSEFLDRHAAVVRSLALQPERVKYLLKTCGLFYWNFRGDFASAYMDTSGDTDPFLDLLSNTTYSDYFAKTIGPVAEYLTLINWINTVVPSGQLNLSDAVTQNYISGGFTDFVNNMLTVAFPMEPNGGRILACTSTSPTDACANGVHLFLENALGDENLDPVWPAGQYKGKSMCDWATALHNTLGADPSVSSAPVKFCDLPSTTDFSNACNQSGPTEIQLLLLQAGNLQTKQATLSSQNDQLLNQQADLEKRLAKIRAKMGTPEDLNKLEEDVRNIRGS